MEKRRVGEGKIMADGDTREGTETERVLLLEVHHTVKSACSERMSEEVSRLHFHTFFPG